MRVLGERLGAWRRHCGASQQELAARAGLRQAALSRIERGTFAPSLRTLFRLADALRLTPGRLLDEDPPRPSLGRFGEDAVARAVVNGERRGLAREQRTLADALASHLAPALMASLAPGARRARRTGWRAFVAARQRYGTETMERLVRRALRFLPAGDGDQAC